MSKPYDIAIIGAGIVGAACAAETARAGLRTLILDRSCIGGGTTACGMGHIVVMDDSPAQLALTHTSRTLWQQLAPELPADVEYDQCGTLWVAADEEEMEEVHRKKALCDQHNIRAEVWDARQLAAAEPSLRHGLAGALRVPDDGVLYPPCGARFLLERARAAGAEFRPHSDVRHIADDGTITLADKSRIPANITLNAAGCASPDLTPGIIVRPRKGHLVITDRYPAYVHHQIVELGYLKSAHSVSTDSVAFNIQPRKTGQMLIGSSRQYDATDTRVDSKILSKMLARCGEYLPDVGKLSAIRVWTGHRPATPDKLPLIGPSAKSKHIWLATGHEGLGITTSTGTGRLIIDLLLNRKPIIPPEPYLPTRSQSEDHH